MTELKFELSVLFTKNSSLSPYTDLEMIAKEYKKFFGKEVKDERLLDVLCDIINDQLEMSNYSQLQEVPEDFELR